MFELLLARIIKISYKYEWNKGLIELELRWVELGWKLITHYRVIWIFDSMKRAVNQSTQLRSIKPTNPIKRLIDFVLLIGLHLIVDWRNGVDGLIVSSLLFFFIPTQHINHQSKRLFLLWLVELVDLSFINCLLVMAGDQPSAAPPFHFKELHSFPFQLVWPFFLYWREEK